MASLKELKGRINSVKSTQKITKAKQMVAAAKLRKAQASAEAARPYAARLAAVMGSHRQQGHRQRKQPQAAGRHRQGSGPPAGRRQQRQGPVRRVQLEHRQGRAASRRAELEAAGQDRAVLPGRPQGPRGDPPRPIPRRSSHSFDTTRSCANRALPRPRRIADELIALYEAGKFDVAHLFYLEVPVARWCRTRPSSRSSRSPPPRSTAAEAGAAVEYEPDEEEILAALLPRYLKTQLFGALLENQASEQGASMTAMDNATRNAGDLINKLTIQYNRSRQAAITTELIEIIAGAEAL